MLSGIPDAIVAGISAGANEPEHRNRLNVLIMTALAFCNEPETFPVFREWYARGYDKEAPEDAAKIRELTPETLSELAFAVLTLIDPQKAAELVTQVAESRK